MTEQNRLEINWINSVGGALGAVSAAVVLSTLGTAGTLIGAAIGSLCITVGGAIYAYSLRAARERLQERRWLLSRGLPPEAAEAELQREQQDEGPARLQMLRELPWRRIGAASAALFVVAMGVILAFELATGRPVSSYTGGTSDTDRGTSVPGLGGRGETPAPDAPSPPAEAPEDEPPDQQAPDQQAPDPLAPVAPEETPDSATETPAEPSTEPSEPSSDAP